MFAILVWSVLLPSLLCSEQVADTLPNKLDDTYGQCPVPRLCDVRCRSLVDEPDKAVEVKCDKVHAGPYVPEFASYFIAPRLWSFDFSGNEISALDERSFYTDNSLPINLTFLNFSKNYISYIHERTFSGFVSKNLRVLDLSYNSLSSINNGVLNDMPALEILDLSHNRLIDLDSICAVRFGVLKHLHLASNSIPEVKPDCLKNITNGRPGVEVDLSSNLIPYVTDCLYESAETIDLSKNPLLCGCSARFSGKLPCLNPDSNVKAYLSTCATSPDRTCQLPLVALQYKAIDNLKYSLVVSRTGQVQPIEVDVAVYEYKGLGTDEASAVTAHKSSGLSASQTSFDLVRGSNYTVCLTHNTSPTQKSCRFVQPVLTGPVNSANIIIWSYPLLFSFILAFIFYS